MSSGQEQARLVSVSRVYADVNKRRPPSYWNYEKHQITWMSPQHYFVVRKIGRGKYSEVFLSHHVVKNKDGQKDFTPCVIKVLKPVKTKKILREVNILRNLAGGPNIVSLFDCIRDEVTKSPALVFEHINNVNYKLLFEKMSDLHVRLYIYEVLRALKYAHSQGIMHRDVKPQNIMFDPALKQIRLIDWGLAEFYHPGTLYNVRVASRYYKGPELLVDLQDYDYSLDIWSIGCILAALIFKQDPFFPGRDNSDQLVIITKVLGTDELNAYLSKYLIELDSQFDSIMGKYEKIPWKAMVTPDNEHLATPQAIDLLSRMLVFDHQKRITAAEAMEHEYFDPVRPLNDPLKPAPVKEEKKN